MSLRWKVILIYAIPLLLLVVVFNIFSRLFLLNSFREIEENDLRKDVEAFRNAILNEITQVERVGVDWAPWDDTFDFVAGERPDYLEVNLSDDVLANLRLSGMAILDLNGQLVAEAGYDLVNERGMPIPAELVAVLRQPFFVQHETNNSVKSGLLVYNQQVYIVSAHPITSSDYSRQPNGILVLLRLIDDFEIGLIAQDLGVEVYTDFVGGSGLTTEDAAAYRQLQNEDEGHVYIAAVSAQRIFGYTLMEDIAGQPALLLHVERGREIFSQGNISILYFIVAFILAGIVLAGTTLVLMNRSLLTPIIQLSELVTKVGKSGDLTLRSPLNSADEIGGLANQINHTFDALEKTAANLLENEQRLQWITENMVDVVTQLDKDWNIVYVSPSVRPLLGYTPESMVGFSVLSMVHKEDREGVFTALREAVEKQATTVRTEYRFPDAAGNYRWIESQARLLYDADGQHIGAIIGARDISERMKAEEKLHLNEFSLHNATEGILWIDQASVILFVNEGAGRMLGYAPTEIVDKTISQFDLDLPQTGWSGFMAQVRQQPGYSRQARFRSKSGQSLIIQTNSNFTTFAGKAFVVVFLRRVLE